MFLDMRLERRWTIGDHTHGMSAKAHLEFVLLDKVEGVEITPATIGFIRFNEFNRQAQEFIEGSERLPLDDAHVRIEDGSYKLLVYLPMLAQTALEPDLQLLQRQDSLGEIDPKRAEIVAKWQARSKSNPDFRVQIRPEGMRAQPIEFNVATEYRVGAIEPWVKVEKYLFGTVIDMGGASKANVHIRLDDTGQLVLIGTDQGYLKEQRENRLYHKVLVRVSAEQHHKTGQMRRLRLLSFEDYEPRFDETALASFVAAGTRAWADVPDAVAWVREQRGGGA